MLSQILGSSSLTDRITHDSYTSWLHDQTRCREPWRCWACEQIQFLFLIRRWEITSKHHSCRIPKSVLFLHVPLGFKSLLQSLRGLAVDVQSSPRPFLGPQQLLARPLLPEGPAAPEESRMRSPCLPDLNAAGGAQRQGRCLLQRLSVATFGNQSIHSKCFRKLPSNLCFAISHPKSPVPGEGLRRYGNAPPQHSAVFSAS